MKRTVRCDVCEGKKKILWKRINFLNSWTGKPRYWYEERWCPECGGLGKLEVR